jgi:ketosteroid isomerase-like protein
MPGTRTDRVTWIPGLLLMIATAVPLAAQTSAAAPALPNDVQATHEALRALKNGAQAAFNRVGMSGSREDLEKLLDFVADGVILVPMNGQTAIGKQGIIDYFGRTMTGPSRTVQSVHHEFEVAELTTLYGDDTGVAYGNTKGTYALAGGMNFEVNANWTATMVKQNGKWLLASFQFGPSIFDNPLLTQAVRSMYWGVAISALVALAAGFTIGRWTARKSH